VVGSVDSAAAKYVAVISVQAGRQEIIADMKEMCKVRCSLCRSTPNLIFVSACPYSSHGLSCKSGRRRGSKGPKKIDILPWYVRQISVVLWRRLINYEDGVSEGQFQQVLDGGEYQEIEFI